MLRSKMLSIIRVTSIQPVRLYRDRKIYDKNSDQAGFRRMRNEMGDAEPFMDDPEADLDADFNQLSQSHRDHERELAIREEQKKYFMIKKKYFKTEKQPNLLTWAEKEQIRHLHKKDPEEWTIERLAQSFPATEEVIGKILKAKWTPKSLEHVQRHDESVKKQWAAYKANQLKNLDPHLREHLKKFSQRNFDSTQNAYVQTPNDQIEFQFPKPKKQEFTHLITSCKAYRQQAEPKKIVDEQAPQIESGEETGMMLNNSPSTIQLGGKLRREIMTFDELKNKLKIDESHSDEEVHLSVSGAPKNVPIDKEALTQTKKALTCDDFEEIQFGDSIDEPQIQVANYDNKEADDYLPAEIETINLTPRTPKYDDKLVSTSKLQKDVQLPAIQHKIPIPPELQKQGSIYRLYDCFYDDKGIFMYRVPGLSD